MSPTVLSISWETSIILQRVCGVETAMKILSYKRDLKICPPKKVLTPYQLNFSILFQMYSVITQTVVLLSLNQIRPFSQDSQTSLLSLGTHKFGLQI